MQQNVYVQLQFSFILVESETNLQQSGDCRRPHMVTCYVTVPEIEQGLGDAVGSDVTISFTPNLMPMVLTYVCLQVT